MKKIKVLQILEATIGGTRTHLNLLVSYLNKNKFDITVICSALREKSFMQDIEIMKKHGVSVYLINMVREISLTKDLSAFINIYNIIRRGKYDIIHTHSSKAGFLGRLAARLAGINTVFYTPHAFKFQGYSKGIKRLLFLLIERIMSKITTNLICVSESEKNIAVQSRVARLSQIVTIPNAVIVYKDEISKDKLNNIKRELGIDCRHLVVGIVGHFRPQKGYSYFLEAASCIHENFKDVVFLIIGSGNGRYKIERMIRQFNLKDSVILLEPIGDMNRYYTIMDIFVLTSLWEGMPYSILEAMSIGKPVVATDVTGSCDIVLNNETGLLVPPKNPRAVSEAIVMLLKDSKKRDYLGRNARELINKKYLMKDRILDIEGLYERWFLGLKNR